MSGWHRFIAVLIGTSSHSSTRRDHQSPFGGSHIFNGLRYLLQDPSHADRVPEVAVKICHCNSLFKRRKFPGWIPIASSTPLTVWQTIPTSRAIESLRVKSLATLGIVRSRTKS